MVIERTTSTPDDKSDESVRVVRAAYVSTAIPLMIGNRIISQSKSRFPSLVRVKATKSVTARMMTRSESAVWVTRKLLMVITNCVVGGNSVPSSWKVWVKVGTT